MSWQAIDAANRAILVLGVTKRTDWLKSITVRTLTTRVVFKEGAARMPLKDLICVEVVAAIVMGLEIDNSTVFDQDSVEAASSLTPSDVSLLDKIVMVPSDGSCVSRCNLLRLCQPKYGSTVGKGHISGL